MHRVIEDSDPQDIVEQIKSLQISTDIFRNSKKFDC